MPERFASCLHGDEQMQKAADVAEVAFGGGLDKTDLPSWYNRHLSSLREIEIPKLKQSEDLEVIVQCGTEKVLVRGDSMCRT